MTLSFNLLDKPWIQVRTTGGGTEEVSVRDIFRRAGDFQGIAGEIPTQEVAILRLLLAIMYRSTAKKRTQDNVLLQWSAWWQARELPLQAIDEYLDRHHDRFDLWHPSAPFMQVADLRTAKGGASGLAKIIAEVPAGDKFFTTRDGKGIEALSIAEAARWLIHTQAFDVSGIKSGAVGDERVSGGKGYPIGIGISGWFGMVIAEGASLIETLLLNLVLTPDPTTDSVVWEREPQDAGEDWLHSQPTGTADLYTWQSRRIRLFEREGQIYEVLLCNGDKLGPHNLQTMEPLSAWRYSEPQTKKAGHAVYMPRTHEVGRALWRGLEPLLLKESPDHKSIRPGLFTWLAALRLAGFLARDHVIRLRAIGIEYGSQSAVVAATIDDSLPMSVAVLGEDHLAQVAIDAAQVALDAVIVLANLATDLAHAAATDPETDRPHAFEAGYAALDPLFRRWFASLTSDTESRFASASWQLALRQVLIDLGSQLCRDAGPAAITGRLKVVASGNAEREDVLDTARAWHRFISRLREKTPAAEPARQSSRQEEN